MTGQRALTFASCLNGYPVTSLSDARPQNDEEVSGEQLPSQL